MKKKRTIIIAVIVCILAAGIGAGIYMIYENQQANAEAEAQLALTKAYYYQSAAFYLDIVNPEDGKYVPYPEDGKYGHLRYIDLAYYRKVTGSTLTINDVQDYLSEEYEENREVRIYTNGRHPEIQSYVEWKLHNNKKADSYGDDLITILSDYERENYFDKGLESPFGNFSELTFEQLDELIKKEADPAYEMKLEP